MDTLFKAIFPCVGEKTQEIGYCYGTKEKAKVFSVLLYCTDYQFGDILSFHEETEGNYYTIKEIIEPGKFKLYRAISERIKEKDFSSYVNNLANSTKHRAFMENWNISIPSAFATSHDNIGIVLIPEINIIYKVADFIRGKNIICPDLMRDAGDEINYKRHLKLSA